MDSVLLGYESAARLHKFIVTHEDLTETTANTAQDIVLATVKDGDVVELLAFDNEIPFEDSSDAAFNSTAATLGDAADPDRYLASSQLNANGTEITRSIGTGTKFIYLAAGQLILNVASMTAKALADIDTGKAVALVRIHETARY